MIKWIFSLLVLVATASGTALAADTPALMVFEGSVLAGQTYTHSLPQAGLTFTLEPSDKGWQIGVVAGPESKAACASLSDITLPLHGVNPTQLEGWHLRNATNTGPNDGSVIAPDTEREFNYALSCDDRARIMASYLCSMTGSQKCEDTGAVKVGVAVLTMTNYDFDDVKPGEQAGFTHLDFKLAVYEPAALAHIPLK